MSDVRAGEASPLEICLPHSVSDPTRKSLMASAGSIVMVVDDDKSVRDALARLLRSAGICCRVFDSAEQFLSLPDLTTAGCVVIDVQMPGMRGLELQQVCRARCPEVPLIVISAFNDEQAEKTALSDGARAFFHKPFDTAKFLTLVRQLIADC